jgi:hypothetical protein
MTNKFAEGAATVGGLMFIGAILAQSGPLALAAVIIVLIASFNMGQENQ